MKDLVETESTFIFITSLLHTVYRQWYLCLFVCECTCVRERGERGKKNYCAVTFSYKHLKIHTHTKTWFGI